MYNLNTSNQSYHGQQFHSPMSQNNSYKTESIDNQYMNEQTFNFKKMSLNTTPFEPTDFSSTEFDQVNSLTTQVDEYFATKSYMTNKNKSQVHTMGKVSKCLHEESSECHNCGALTCSETCSDIHSDHDHHADTNCDSHSSVCCDSECGDDTKNKKALRVDATPFIFAPTEASIK